MVYAPLIPIWGETAQLRCEREPTHPWVSVNDITKRSNFKLLIRYLYFYNVSKWYIITICDNLVKTTYSLHKCYLMLYTY